MKKILLSLIAGIFFTLAVNAETYTHQFSKDELKTTGGVVTLSEKTWTASDAKSIAWNTSGKGIQIGKKAETTPNYTLSTSAFADFTIKSVTVYSCIATSGDAKLTIKAGETTSEEYTLTTTNAGYTLNCNTKGDIVISWNATQRAYYVSKIEVVYELPAEMVDLEEPIFKTPTDSIYADKVTVTAETADSLLVLYYTLDGTVPSYEDYINETGTTKCSKYYVMYPELTESTTIKVMAVKVDGESVYKSDVVEAEYIVSATKPYAQATAITSGKRYALVASNDSIADAFVPAKTKGFLNGRKTKKLNKSKNSIEAVEYNAFTFTEADGGYTIQDASKRYMSIDDATGEFVFTTEQPATGAVWSISFEEGKCVIKSGEKQILYMAGEDKFGCFAEANSDMTQPSLYELREYPEATITPADGSEVKGLQEIIISCEEGISASESLVLRVRGGEILKDNKPTGKYEVDATYKCEQVDKNTLRFTNDTPLKSNNNIEIYVRIEQGDIFLNPDAIGYPIPLKHKSMDAICKFKHKGDAKAAVITKISPADKETLEELSHFVFTFNNIVNHSDSTELKPTLYADGKYFALEKTSTDSKGNNIDMNSQLALKTTEKLIGNGTYTLEIPKGYFVDMNGNKLEGSKFTYTVKNDSGILADIKDVTTEGETSWIVFNTTGIKVLETTDANDLNRLEKGIYIINGRKILVK